jgi:WD40 repeat protein
MNTDRLVACLEAQIHIFELAQMTCIQILNTSSNLEGLVALSDRESQLLAFPHGNAGEVVIYDCLAPRLLAKVPAHKAPVVEMQFNRSGTMLATASITGTVIRVFAAPSGEKLFSFRRGNRPSRIVSIAFSEGSEFLAAGSSSGTVHVFSVEAAALARSNPQAAASGSLGTPGVNAPSGGASSMSSTLRAAADNGTSTVPSERKRSSGDGAAAESIAGFGGTAIASNVPSWKDSLKTSTISALGYMQNWSFSAVSSLHVLPDHMQEFADSFRASSIARVPGAEGDFTLAIVGSASKPSRSSGEKKTQRTPISTTET